MHILTALSLKNRALIALVTIVAAVFGLIGVGSLKQELMPSVQFPAIAVVTSYPGASPDVVNNDVSGPIETALRGVPQLESTTATSSTGASMVVAQFTYGVDLSVTEQKVERAISRISQLLPASADTQVASGSIDDFPVIQIAVTPAEGETPEATAQLVERIATPELSDLEGVRDAQLAGARGDRVTIVPNVEALAAQGLSPQTITDTLQQSGVLIAAGTVTDGDRTLAVQAGSAISSAEEIAALPLAVSPEQLAAQQQAILEQQAQASLRPGIAEELPAVEAAPTPTIGELATVTLEPNPQQSISRVDGAPALTIGVTKMSAANTVDVSHAVQEKLDELQDQLGGAQLTVIFDQAPYIEKSIETLTTEGLLGLIFAVLVILVFLMSVRATLVTAISIPTSVLLTFVGLNFAEYTLNLLTLGALTISIGRVVDDSIVVIENIKRHLTVGADRTATIIEAVREVAGAITASTITTVAVFLPMAFVDGMVGELFRPFAFTVTIALIASLLVSLTIVPVLAYWFLRPESGSARRFGRRRTAVAASPEDAASAEAGSAATDPTGAEAEPVTALQRGYRPIIEWTLRRPAITLVVAVVVFGLTIAASPFMKTNFLGADEQNSVGLTQTLAPGTSLDAQLAQAERVETALGEVAAVETVQVTIGSAGGGMTALFGGGSDGAVSYSITTDPGANQEQTQTQIRDAVDALDDAGEFSIGQSGGGVTSSSAIEVNVTAPDQQLLAEASEALTAELAEQGGLRQIESDLAQSRPYLSIVVDRAAAAQVGLTEAGVAGQVASQMQPSQIGQITMEANTIAVYLQNGVAPTDEAGVAALPIQTAAGPQALSTLAVVAVADGPVTVRTEDGVRMVTVSALPEGDDLTAASVAVNAALESVELPEGASASIGGVMTQQSEAFQQLGLALLAAILIVYVVMVATFRSLLQPLLLLISVPFSATGAILLLIVTGIPLGVASLIGVLMLIGIVVTNAIVLVDLVNQYRARGDALRDAVLHGTLQRLRPIVMTALATILALTPMALGITGKGGFISQPLAVVVIGGLLSSTVLTLVVLPTLYYIVERRREGGSRPRRRRGADSGPGGIAAAGLVGAGAGLGAGGGMVPDPREPSEPSPGDTLPVERIGPRRGRSTLGLPVVEEASPMPPMPPIPPEPIVTPPAPTASVTPPVSPEPRTPPMPAVPVTPVQPVEHAKAEDASGPDDPPAPDVPADDRGADAGPATAQMSLALNDLGFVGEQDPLRPDEIDEIVERAEPIEPIERAEPVVPAAPAESVAPIEPDGDDSAAPGAHGVLPEEAAAPPVTGELDWEQLLWQATQEVDEAIEEESGQADAADAPRTPLAPRADPEHPSSPEHGDQRTQD
ncbi:efflux RND transporter permease subunit [Leucobacter rhizosphaerae]|uniref:Efflux RND transporter permease subunit n=1 Tax=Leucobacter rhizosphaerae TaxID=2932245 RepID=A0ABY4FUQ8_9MICO|nr:efflux RND transporter permease subunit [Leucobacter rhizosphaerae]UOQ60012.1 efflux RND transporter permease subunit [Leucobacter rhizosphaerae]